MTGDHIAEYGGVAEAESGDVMGTPPSQLSGAELAVAHAVWIGIGGPDGEDWLQAQLLAPDALEAIEEQGYAVISRQLLDHLEREAGLCDD